MSIKFNFHDRQGKQNGRIHWRFDVKHSKMLFFTPVNQVGLELDTDGEKTLLLRLSKKLYWQGDFSFLLDRLWGIDLTLEELKQLLIKGLIPEAKIKEKGIVIDLANNPKDQSPQIVNIRQNDATLTLKILKSESRPGNIVLLEYDQRFQLAEIEDVLADD
ncbi:MAG: lipoprotein insertase outer membrane protein LolB [Chrysiogenales bacterium]